MNEHKYTINTEPKDTINKLGFINDNIIVDATPINAKYILSTK